MTKPPLDPRPDAGRPSPDRIMSSPTLLQSGERASIGQALEFAVSLDHLRRERPELLTKLRLACAQPGRVAADTGNLAVLDAMGLTTATGLPMADARPVVLAMLRGPEGQEVVENPFLDVPSRTLFDYLRHGALAAMVYDPAELKAVHENETVADLMDAAPDASWVGYVRGKGAGPGRGAPDRN